MNASDACSQLRPKRCDALGVFTWLRIQIDRLAGHTAAVTGVVFSADNSTLYTSSLGENVIGWDITHLNNLGQRLLSPGYGPNEAPVTFIAVSLTGEIAAEYADGTVRFWARGSNSPSPPIQVTRSAMKISDSNAEQRRTARK